MEVFDIDKFVDEIKDDPCYMEKINYLEITWYHDYDIINDLLKASGIEPIQQTRHQYMQECYKIIDEVLRRLKSLNKHNWSKEGF